MTPDRLPNRNHFAVLALYNAILSVKYQDSEFGALATFVGVVCLLIYFSDRIANDD